MNRTEKYLIDVRGMTNWMNGRMHDGTDPFNHLMTVESTEVLNSTVPGTLIYFFFKPQGFKFLSL